MKGFGGNPTDGRDESTSTARIVGKGSSEAGLSAALMESSGDARLLKSLVALGACWILAFLLALTDIDFFTITDLLDTTELHHEHIVAGLVLLGVVLAIVPWLSGRGAKRDA